MLDKRVGLSGQSDRRSIYLTLTTEINTGHCYVVSDKVVSINACLLFCVVAASAVVRAILRVARERRGGKRNKRKKGRAESRASKPSGVIGQIRLQTRDIWSGDCEQRRGDIFLQVQHKVTIWGGPFHRSFALCNLTTDSRRSNHSRPSFAYLLRYKFSDGLGGRPTPKGATWITQDRRCLSPLSPRRHTNGLTVAPRETILLSLRGTSEGRNVLAGPAHTFCSAVRIDFGGCSQRLHVCMGLVQTLIDCSFRPCCCRAVCVSSVGRCLGR